MKKVMLSIPIILLFAFAVAFPIILFDLMDGNQEQKNTLIEETKNKNELYIRKFKEKRIAPYMESSNKVTSSILDNSKETPYRDSKTNTKNKTAPFIPFKDKLEKNDVPKGKEKPKIAPDNNSKEEKKDTSKDRMKELQDYNVIIMDLGKEKNCGGTVIKTKDKANFYVLTALHCITNHEDGTYRELGFVDAGSEIYRFEVLDISRKRDLAVLKITDKNPKLKQATVKKSDLVEDEEVWTLGYGAGVPDSISKGGVSLLGVKGWYGEPCNQINITAWYGSSGGGLFTKENELAGVLVQFGPQDARVTGWMYTISEKAVRGFLTRLNLL